MGSIAMFSAFYMIKMAFFFVFYLLMKLTPLGRWENGKSKLEKMSQEVFFSDLFGIIIDAYFEFCICCYYNLVFEISSETLNINNLE